MSIVHQIVFGDGPLRLCVRGDGFGHFASAEAALEYGKKVATGEIRRVSDRGLGEPFVVQSRIWVDQYEWTPTS